MKYSRLCSANQQIVNEINRLMRKLNSQSNPINVVELADLIAGRSAIFIAQKDGQDEILAIGIVSFQNLISHKVARIHNLVAEVNQDPQILHGIILAMTSEVIEGLPDRMIQIDIPADDAGMATFIQSLGYKPYKSRVPYRLKL